METQSPIFGPRLSLDGCGRASRGKLAVKVLNHLGYWDKALAVTRPLLTLADAAPKRRLSAWWSRDRQGVVFSLLRKNWIQQLPAYRLLTRAAPEVAKCPSLPRGLNRALGYSPYTNSLMGTPVASPMELAILMGRPTGVM